MNDKEIVKELKKLKYHVKLLGETIDLNNHPVESLILEMDWDQSEVKKAHDIFEKYDTQLRAKKNVNWSAFEKELCDAFDINYQIVKSIIISFHRNGQWTDVCHGYAMSFEPSTPIEFHHITRPRP